MSQRCSISLLSEIKSTIAFDQPKLSATLHDGKVVVEGVFRVLPWTVDITPQGAIAKYQIQIIFDTAYPESEPKVFEIGNSIDGVDDNHINPDSSCCNCVWEVWIAADREISVQDYFDGSLKNFFFKSTRQANHRRVAFRRGEAWEGRVC